VLGFERACLMGIDDIPQFRPGFVAEHCGKPARLDQHGCIRCSVCGLAGEVKGTIVNVGPTTASNPTLQLETTTGWVQLAWPFELRNGHIARWFRAVEGPPIVNVGQLSPVPAGTFRKTMDS